jgi:hypothetical protein
MYPIFYIHLIDELKKFPSKTFGPEVGALPFDKNS